MATLEVAVSITDTEVFQKVLEIVLDAYQHKTDKLVRETIKKELKRHLVGKWMSRAYCDREIQRDENRVWLPNDHYDPVNG